MVDRAFVSRVLTYVAILIAAGVLFYYAYDDYAKTSKLTITGVMFAAIGVACITVLGFQAKDLFDKSTLAGKHADANVDIQSPSENPLGEGGSGGTGTTARYKAVDSQPSTPMPKRWWRTWGKK